MTTVEAVNREASEDMADDSSDAMSIRELDPKLEDKVCSLWDMSTNLDVAHFLLDFKITDVVLEIIDKTKSPRLLEITIGILGNICSFSDLCQDISKNKPLLNATIPLIGSSDSATVVQVLRLIHTSVIDDDSWEPWLEALKNELSCMQNIKFIFENSLNIDVLKGTLQLLYYMFERDDNICLQWADNDYVLAVINAGKQLFCKGEFVSIDEFWLLLNLMCQHQQNIEALMPHYDDLYPVYDGYFTMFDDYEYRFLPPMERVAAIAASFTTLATLLDNETTRRVHLEKGNSFENTAKRLYKSVSDVLNRGTIIGSDDQEASKELADIPESIDGESSKECNGDQHNSKLQHSVSLQEDDYNSLFILKETIREFCTIVFNDPLSDEEQED